ncbi:MAG: methyltransferase [Desulfopila sp.]|jgi:tRNA1Val (adenine37-N6)-methyltransferase|nr:methyltransferase [Desulfopila sp.]
MKRRSNETSEITKDTLFNGNLICYQNKNGYRFSIDSVLLAHFSLSWKNATVLDMGCGCGILSLILLYRNYSEIHCIQGIEVQDSLVVLARKNCEVNNFEKKCTIIQGDYRDIRTFFKAETFTHIICNPPFFPIGSGRTSENTESCLARHQKLSSPDSIAEGAAFALKNKGVFTIIFPAELCMDLLFALNARKIRVKRMQVVYSYPLAENASLVLLECIKNGGVGVKVLKPLYIYDMQNGPYSKEIQEMYCP